MYPQEETLYSKCINCSEDIMEGQEFIESYGYDFCSTYCYISQAIEDTTITRRVAGDNTIRIV